MCVCVCECTKSLRAANLQPAKNGRKRALIVQFYPTHSRTHARTQTIWEKAIENFPFAQFVSFCAVSIVLFTWCRHPSTSSTSSYGIAHTIHVVGFSFPICVRCLFASFFHSNVWCFFFSLLKNSMNAANIEFRIWDCSSTSAGYRHFTF